MANGSMISQDLAQEAFTDALRRFCGRGKAMSCEQLAERSGVPERTIRSYREGQTTPGLGALLSLVAALPPAFANELLALAGLGGAERIEGAVADSFRVNRALTAITAMIGEHLEDGRVDHRELAEEKRAVKDALEVLQGFVKSSAA